MVPTLFVPTLLVPTQLVPTLLKPTVLIRELLVPTLLVPTLLAPTLLVPTLWLPTLLVPTFSVTTLLVPTLLVETLSILTLLVPTLLIPKSLVPTLSVLQNKKNDTEKEQKKKTIDNLQGTVNELRSKFANRSVYICGECEYLADCVHDFNDHTHSQGDLEIEENSLFKCRFCDETLETLAEVMYHNKVNHTSNVQDCINFLENSCWYGDKCWFLHRESLQNSEPSFKCKFCEQKFRNRNLLIDHMKLLHIQFVPKCKSEGDCKFYSRKCWFVHQEEIEIAYLNAKNQSQSQNISHSKETFVHVEIYPLESGIGSSLDSRMSIIIKSQVGLRCKLNSCKIFIRIEITSLYCISVATTK